MGPSPVRDGGLEAPHRVRRLAGVPGTSFHQPSPTRTGGLGRRPTARAQVGCPEAHRRDLAATDPARQRGAAGQWRRARSAGSPRPLFAAHHNEAQRAPRVRRARAPLGQSAFRHPHLKLLPALLLSLV
jgi:hypothetical protein